MSFTYRENQNTPLTWAQLDGNFREVENVQREVSTQVMAAAASAESATAASAASQSSAVLAEEMARISVVRWCGNSTTPPTTRLDGSPLKISDEYGNLTDNLRYNWTGSVWVALNSSAQQLEERLTSPGNTIVAHQRTELAVAVDFSIAKALSQLSVDIWELSSLVKSRPVPSDFSTWNWTPAFEAARVTIGALGGGSLTFGAPGVYQASEIRHDRSIIFDGGGTARVELKQIGGSNRDFLKSENFDALTGTGATVSGNPLVPSWFGLKDIRVNGNRHNATTNPTGNTSGRAIAWYGAAQIMQGNVLVYGAAGDNIYTEYSNVSGSSGWRGQEEGQFDNVISRDSGGVAWIFRGPHNSRLNSYLGGFNDGYGFRSESGPNYDGGFDYIGTIHTYANGLGSSPAADTGIYIGEIARISVMINDGDNAIIAGSNVQIGQYRGYNIGGEQDGLDLKGNAIQIGSVNAVVWVNSVKRKAIKSSGSRNKIGTLDLVANNPDNDAIVVTGSDLHIGGGYVQGFSGTGRTGLDLAGTKHNINLELTGCATAFKYTAGGNNRVNLEINTSAGQVPVAGSAPTATDRFTVNASGTSAGRMKATLKTDPLEMDTTTYATTTVAHGLLYTPDPMTVGIDWLVSSPDSSVWQEAFKRVVSTSATSVTIGYKLAVAAPAGTRARIGINIDITQAVGTILQI